MEWSNGPTDANIYDLLFRLCSLFAVVGVGTVFWRVIIAWALFAFVGAHACTFVVDVTRLLAPRSSEFKTNEKI